MRKVVLVVPCFNEEGRLDPDEFLGERTSGIELVFVDDGSTDRTRNRLEAMRRERPRQVRIVCLEKNSGKAEAVRRGMIEAFARFPDAVGFWDADLSTPLAELPAFVAILEANADVDIVLGSRVKLMGRTIERQAWRHYLGRMFATAASVALDLPIYDTQCGAKLFRATPVIERIFEKPFRTRWVFDVEILARFMELDPGGPEHAARALYEVPVERWRHVAGSKVKASDLPRTALDLLDIYRIRRTQRRATRIRDHLDGGRANETTVTKHERK